MAYIRAPIVEAFGIEPPAKEQGLAAGLLLLLLLLLLPCVSAPPVSAVQRTTGPSGEWGYGARCLCWARAPSGSATCERVVPTDRHSFVVCQ